MADLFWVSFREFILPPRYLLKKIRRDGAEAHMIPTWSSNCAQTKRLKAERVTSAALPVSENRLAKDQWRRLFTGMSLLISQYVRMQLAITTMKPSEKMALSAIFCLLGIA